MKLEEILLSDDVIKSIENSLDYLLEIIPEIKSMIGFNHKHPHHHLDVWQHTLLAISLSKKDFDIRLTLLLHDIGKPFSYQEGEVRHFKNHPIISSKMARIILKRLHYQDDYIEKICYLIHHHDTPIMEEEIINNPRLTKELLEVQRCDALAHHPDKLQKRKEYIKTINDLIIKNNY